MEQLLQISLTLITLASSLHGQPVAHNTENVQSQESCLADLGVRVGVDTESKVNLVSYELFNTLDTSWSWTLSEGLHLNLDIEVAIGGLSGEGETAIYGRVAPVAELHFGDSPLSLVLSSGPSLYSEDNFDNLNIGGHFQFTSSLGFNWQINDVWAIGYRFQHTSNANLNDPNPGLDMHTANIAFSF